MTDVNVQTTLEPIKSVKSQEGFDTLSSAKCSCKDYPSPRDQNSRSPTSARLNPYKRNQCMNSPHSNGTRSKSSECGATSRSPPVISSNRGVTIIDNSH